mmetsp:Transcript_59328/g.185952  ORF Transcript_59328/g.185952 Transcript_59328/m.185952 type:complete len:221 (+) Transcript_59328:895-1557(+)
MSASCWPRRASLSCWLRLGRASQIKWSDISGRRAHDSTAVASLLRVSSSRRMGRRCSSGMVSTDSRACRGAVRSGASCVFGSGSPWMPPVSACGVRATQGTDRLRTFDCQLNLSSAPWDSSGVEGAGIRGGIGGEPGGRGGTGVRETETGTGTPRLEGPPCSSEAPAALGTASGCAPAKFGWRICRVVMAGEACLDDALCSSRAPGPPSRCCRGVPVKLG